MKTVIEMALKVGLEKTSSGWRVWTKDLEAFAELVRADERKKYKWDVHSCGPTSKRYACVAMREAVAAEREACAKVCESAIASIWEYCPEDIKQTSTNVCNNLAAAIRARTNP